jgi:holo-ACP synthase CitX
LREKILEDREKRYNKIIDLAQGYSKPVLCGKLNYPGNNKNTLEVKSAFNILMQLISGRYCQHLKYIEILGGFDGPSILMVLDMPVLEAKKAAVMLEEGHELGRLFDIDIYSPEGEPVSRTEVYFNNRTCLLCESDGKECSRGKHHKLEEILEKVDNMIRGYGEIKDEA